MVRYEEGKQRHLPLHRDQSSHSFTASKLVKGLVVIYFLGVGVVRTVVLCGLLLTLLAFISWFCLSSRDSASISFGVKYIYMYYARVYRIWKHKILILCDE